MFVERSADAPTLRQALFVILAALMTAGSLRPIYLWTLFVDREPLRANFESYSDRGTPEYPLFLQRVAAATPPGATIAVFVPWRRSSEGYSYAYFRASYFLAGREVLPLIWDNDRIVRENFQRADYIASWHSRLRPPSFDVVLASHDGELLRRRR